MDVALRRISIDKYLALMFFVFLVDKAFIKIHEQVGLKHYFLHQLFQQLFTVLFLQVFIFLLFLFFLFFFLFILFLGFYS